MDNSLLEQPWKDSPLEIFQFVEVLLCRQDINLNIPFLLIDVGVEMLFKNYLIHFSKITHSDLDQQDKNIISKDFPTLVDLIKKYINASQEEIDELNKIKYYHSLRNKLYHRGDGVLPRKDNTYDYYKLAEYFLHRLLNIDIGIKDNPFSYKLLFRDREILAPNNFRKGKKDLRLISSKAMSIRV